MKIPLLPQPLIVDDGLALLLLILHVEKRKSAAVFVAAAEIFAVVAASLSFLLFHPFSDIWVQ